MTGLTNFRHLLRQFLFFSINNDLEHLRMIIGWFINGPLACSRPNRLWTTSTWCRGTLGPIMYAQMSRLMVILLCSFSLSPGWETRAPPRAAGVTGPRALPYPFLVYLMHWLSVYPIYHMSSLETKEISMLYRPGSYVSCAIYMRRAHSAGKIALIRPTHTRFPSINSPVDPQLKLPWYEDL